MNTYLNNVIYLIFCFIINFTSIYCSSKEDVKLLEEVFKKTNDYWWFVEEKFAEVTVSNLSQRRAVPPDHSEDRFLNTTQLATKYGYEVREHYLTTEDGYILTLIQIVGKGPPVFLMHGFIGSSDDFVVSGPEKALAYLLADLGYNVWLGNARGNKYSRNHIVLNPERRTFWEFSWHEIGIIDLPTMVDYALLVSGADHLTYIGHSQGTTVFFVLNSERPDYNKKFNLMISLGTIAWTFHMKAPLTRALVPVQNIIFPLLNNLGYYEVFPASSTIKFVNSEICSSSKLALLSCITTLFESLGFDYDQIDYDHLPVQLSHFPSGSSLRQMWHFSQLSASRDFAQFDFGRKQNLITYGSPTPPSYNVESIIVPIVIFYGDNDFLSSFDDTIILIQSLPNVLSVNRVSHPKFNHYDFIWAKDADVLLYWKIINIIEENVNRTISEDGQGRIGSADGVRGGDDDSDTIAGDNTGENQDATADDKY